LYSRRRREEERVEWETIWETVLGWLAWVWAFWETKFIVSHIGLNVVAATAATIYTGEFRLGKLGEFLYKKILPYILLFGAFAGFGEAANLSGMATLAFAGIESMLLADLLDNLRMVGLKLKDSRGELDGFGHRDAGTGGFTIPRFLTK
jgi:hypothetical protein